MQLAGKAAKKLLGCLGELRPMCINMYHPSLPPSTSAGSVYTGTKEEMHEDSRLAHIHIELIGKQRDDGFTETEIETIKSKVMRGASTPTALMIAPGVNGFVPDMNKRLPYDVEAAKKLQLAADAAALHGGVGIEPAQLPARFAAELRQCFSNAERGIARKVIAGPGEKILCVPGQHLGDQLRAPPVIHPGLDGHACAQRRATLLDITASARGLAVGGLADRSLSTACGVS